MRNIVYKCLILFILFLSLGIISKSSLDYRNKIRYYLYEDNLAFSKFRNFYNRYLGDIFPLVLNGKETISVFSEKLQYHSISKYLDGYCLKVDYNYLVPVVSNGIVTYIGNKEGYGEVIIVMGDDGVSIWYGNISNHGLKLYDTVSIGDVIGEVNEENLYLVFYNGNYLEYDMYLK